MKNILSSLTSSEKNRILEMHKFATSRNYLSEQKTPSLGIAQGNKVPLENVNIEGIGSGELSVMDETNRNVGAGSVSYPDLTVMSVKYFPPMTLVSKDKTDPTFGTYKNSKGEVVGKVTESGAASRVVLGLSFGNFTFNLSVMGGNKPSISVSGFNEINPKYSFVMGNSVVTDPKRNELIKNGFGKSEDSSARSLAQTIFGNQSWVTNLQKVLPQS